MARLVALVLACASLAAPLRAELAPASVWARGAIPDCLVDVQTRPAPGSSREAIAGPDPRKPVINITFTPRDLTVPHAIERSESLTDPWVEIALAPPGQTAIVDRRIDTSRTYYYRVVAVRGAARSVPSPSVEVDLPRILHVVEGREGALGAKRHKEPDQPSDADGTALLLLMLGAWSAFRRR